jgi:hypothetical protein
MVKKIYLGDGALLDAVRRASVVRTIRLRLTNKSNWQKVVFTRPLAKAGAAAQVKLISAWAMVSECSVPPLAAVQVCDQSPQATSLRHHWSYCHRQIDPPQLVDQAGQIQSCLLQILSYSWHWKSQLWLASDTNDDAPSGGTADLYRRYIRARKRGAIHSVSEAHATFPR